MTGISLSSSLERLSGESTLVYSERAKEAAKRGIDVINLGIGQPDLPTFRSIREEAKRALDEGFTGYTPALGIDELRTAVASHLNSSYGSDIVKEEVAITPGAKVSLFLSFLLYVNPGDEVIILDPGFYSYAEVVKLLGGVPVISFLEKRGNRFYINLDDIASKVSKRTKMIVFNNPSNPTGTVFTPSEVRNLLRLAKEKNLVVLADEIYDYFVYEGSFESVLKDTEWRDNVIYVNGFSKTFSMTGWRLGTLVARKDLIKRVGILAANIYTCPNSFAQRGAVAAFRSWDDVKSMISLFKRRRDVMEREISSINGVESVRAEGAFYMFPGFREVIKKLGISSKDLAIRLIEEKGVVTIPGEVFSQGEGKYHLRMSFATDEEKIKAGVRRINEFVKDVLG